MPVSLKVINENNQEINLNTGIDLGLIRKGLPSITKFKIKNEGNVTARQLIISTTTLNSNNEVSSEEYNNQLKATKWKSFSLYENKGFSSQLQLGDVKPSGFVQGVKETNVNLVSSEETNLTDSWSTGITEFKNNAMTFKKSDGNTNGQIAKRMMCTDVVSCGYFQVEFNVDFTTTTQGQSTTLPYISFPVRINSNGDNRGYLFMLRYRRDDKKFIVAIHKNAIGMTSNTERDYGEKIFETIGFQPFDKSKKFTFKLYNNSLGQPTFEVKYGDINLLLGKVFSDIQSEIVSDTETGSFKEDGNLYIDISMNDGDIATSISNMKINSEELEQFIYMKTLLGDDATNNTIYKTSALISYLED